MKKTLANTKVFLYTPRRHATRPRSVRVHRVVAQSGSAPAWGAGGRRFESCQPDHFPIREALQNEVFCKASNFFALRGIPSGPMVPPCTLSCITFRMHDNFPKPNIHRPQSRKSDPPSLWKINRENYHKIHSLPLANKQKILGICRVHAIHIHCHFLSDRPATPLPCRETGQTGTGKKQFFIALQAGKSYTPPVQTSPFPPLLSCHPFPF